MLHGKLYGMLHEVVHGKLYGILHRILPVLCEEFLREEFLREEIFREEIFREGLICSVSLLLKVMWKCRMFEGATK